MNVLKKIIERLILFVLELPVQEILINNPISFLKTYFSALKKNYLIKKIINLNKILKYFDLKENISKHNAF